MVPGNPPKDVYAPGVRRPESVRKDLQKSMRGGVIEVVDIQFHLHPVRPSRRLIFFMKCYLQAGLAELLLLVAARCSGMQESRTGFLRERTLRSRYSDLVQQRAVGPAKTTIL